MQLRRNLPCDQFEHEVAFLRKNWCSTVRTTRTGRDVEVKRRGSEQPVGSIPHPRKSASTGHARYVARSVQGTMQVALGFSSPGHAPAIGEVALRHQVASLARRSTDSAL